VEDHKIQASNGLLANQININITTHRPLNLVNSLELRIMPSDKSEVDLSIPPGGDATVSHSFRPSLSAAVPSQRSVNIRRRFQRFNEADQTRCAINLPFTGRDRTNGGADR